LPKKTPTDALPCSLTPTGTRSASCAQCELRAEHKAQQHHGRCESCVDDGNDEYLAWLGDDNDWTKQREDRG